MASLLRLARIVGGGARLTAILAVAVAGCNQPAAAPPAAVTAAPAAVSVVQPQRQALRRVVEQPGVVQAFEQTQLFARVPGYVSKVSADIGQKVTAGQVLAEIAVPELEEETNQKNALTRQAEAQVDQAKAALAAAEAAIATVEAAVVEAKALYERWESEAKRITKLVESGTIDVQTRDETRSQFKAAGARVLSTEAGVRKVKADRDKAAADVRYAEARVQVAQADAQRSAALLGYAKIRSPYDGVVTWRKVNTGDLVQPGAGKGDWLFSVARLDVVRIVIAVPEADAGLVRDNAAVKLSIKAAHGGVVDAKVTRISWALEPGARTLRAEIDLPNPDGRLRPGMYVHAQIINQYPECLALPAAAVMKQGDKLVCFLIEDGKAVCTPVQIGRSDGQFTEVLKRQKLGSATVWEEFTGKESVASRAAGLSDGQALPPAGVPAK